MWVASFFFFCIIILLLAFCVVGLDWLMDGWVGGGADVMCDGRRGGRRLLGTGQLARNEERRKEGRGALYIFHVHASIQIPIHIPHPHPTP